MQEYQDYTSTKALPPGHRLPQVVGLTASLGVGGGNSIMEALDHMILMSANHCVHKLSCVTVNKDDLKKFVNIPIDSRFFLSSYIYSFEFGANRLPPYRIFARS